MTIVRTIKNLSQAEFADVKAQEEKNYRYQALAGLCQRIPRGNLEHHQQQLILYLDGLVRRLR